MSDGRERAGFLAFRFEPVGGFRRLPWLAAFWAAFALAAYQFSSRAPFLSASLWLGALPPVWRMSFSTFCRHAGYAARLAVFVAMTTALGRGLLRRVFRADALNVFETLSFGFALGLGAVSLASSTLGLFHEFKPTPIFILAAAFVFLAGWLNVPAPSRNSGAGDWKIIFDGRASKLLAALAAFVLLIEGFYALAPETSHDALVYHLAIPSLYRMSGGIVAAPTLLYSGFPMLIEWAYGFMLFFSDEIAAKLIHWACGAAIAAAFLGMGLRSRRPLMGWVACVVFLAMPMTIDNVVNAGVDVASAYLVLLTAYSLVLFCGGADSAGGLDLVAVLCGLAMGVKYTNWPLLPLVVFLLVLDDRTKRELKRFAAVAGCVVLPWLIKNVYLYRNPVFPFFNELIAPHAEFSSGWRLLRHDALGRDWPATLTSPRLFAEAIFHPWFMTVFGFSHFDHVGPIFLMVLPAFFFVRPASAEARLWLRLLFGLWLIWWLTSAMPRLFFPGLCLFAVFVGVVVDRAEKLWHRRVLLVLLAVVALNGVSAVSLSLARTGVGDYLIGGMPKDEFLLPSRRLWPNSYYPAAEWINQNTPATARVLVLNGGRGYYLRRSFMTSSRLDEDLLAHWLKRSRTADDLRRQLEQAGVTHILINMAWIWGQETPDPAVTPAQYGLLEGFFNRFAVLRYNDLSPTPGATRWTDVYELVPSKVSPKPVLDPLLRWYRSGGLAGLGADGQAALEYDDQAR
jgi:hypothetical protein